ncbi:MATE family efflux transporter [uncultured Enterovirga sp.]|uniref:MATE family efflux transporter n=1 Tax=uncultured Enterovirga sp. TaxID=2026352 RepID=UPI0035CA5AC8
MNQATAGEIRRAALRADWMREVAATLTLAWPMILSNLAGTALATMDLVLIGRLGPEPLAAAALATNLFHAVLISAIGLVTAVSPLVAAEYGRCRHSVRDIRRSVRQGLWVAIAICAPSWLFLSQGETLLRTLGQTPTLAAAAGGYLHALQWALLPNLAFVVLRLFMAALGRPGWGLAIGLLALPVNLLLAWMLIFGRLGAPALGLAGAGIATTITAALAFAALSAVAMTDRRFRRYHLFGRFWRPDWNRFRSIWRIGLPIAVTLAFEVAFFGGAGLLMGVIGTTELAAHTIALQIAALCFMVPLGVGQAATIRVGHALGAADPAAVGIAGWAAFGVAMGFGCLTALLLVAVPGMLVGAFLDPAAVGNGPVIALAVQFLFFAAVFQLADGAQVVGAGMLRGLKDTRRPMLYAALGYWGIGTPAGLLLAFPGKLGGTGLWIGLAIGLAAVSLMLLARWWRRETLRLVPRHLHSD